MKQKVSISYVDKTESINYVDETESNNYVEETESKYQRTMLLMYCYRS